MIHFSCAHLNVMPCRLRVKVREARGLPVMDKASESTDAYVEVKFASLPPQRTRMCPKSLNPDWSQILRFDVLREKHLTDAPVEFKVYDHDVVHDDIIGCVQIDLSPLLMNKGPGQIIGWFPIYDSIRGVRGSLSLSVKLEFGETTESRFREISGAVKFFSISTVLPKYKVSAVIGFVEELIVEDDPEYQTFSFSKARTTNDHRQNTFYHMSGKLRRKIGITVEELGGNAVLGFRQHFDLEGEVGKGIVARGYGTAVLISRDIPVEKASIASVPIEASSPKKSDLGSSVSPRSMELLAMVKPPLAFSGQVHLLSMTTIPSHLDVHIGGMVVARSVKVLKKTHRRRNRDKWWAAIRTEVRSHASVLSCNAVFGYSEHATIEDDVVVLAGYGTACFVYEEDACGDKKKKEKRRRKGKRKKEKKCSSSACHIPYGRAAVPPDSQLAPCRECKRAYVGEILMATIEPCQDASLTNVGSVIQARVCRKYKAAEGKESNAILISEMIPFLDYEMHQQLYFKMRISGANAIFGLHMQVNLGPSMITAIATGTAVYLHGLPMPPSVPPSDDDPTYIKEYCTRRDNMLLIEPIEEDPDESLLMLDEQSVEEGPSNSETISDHSKFNVNMGDAPDSLKSLVDPPLPDGMVFSTTQKIPNVALDIVRSRLIVSFVRLSWSPPSEGASEHLSALFLENYHKIIFELCTSLPCVLCGLQFLISLPNEGEIDFLVTGMALETTEETFTESELPLNISLPSQDDLQFSIEGLPEEPLASSKPNSSTRMAVPLSMKVSTERLSSGDTDNIIVTSLDYIPGAKVKRFLGRVCHHLIREEKENRFDAKDIINSNGNTKLGNLASVFLREAINIARAHTISIGGEALIGFTIDSFSLVTGYCLISFSGDAVTLRRNSKSK